MIIDDFFHGHTIEYFQKNQIFSFLYIKMWFVNAIVNIRVLNVYFQNISFWDFSLHTTIFFPNIIRFNFK
jgi:hypothetical protein